MGETQFTLRGADEVMKNFRRLSPKVQRTTARRATRRAMVPIRNAARRNAKKIDDPTTANSIAKNIAISESAKLGKAIGGVAMRVGAKGGAKQVKGTGAPGGDTWYWRLVELGTAHSKAQPFMRTAFENGNQDKATRVFLEEMQKGINEALR